ncbi:MAG: hypothetical protein HY747_07940 [Elusimicrobia bacterium]|nr:hypothetical protein [Elusimicrobiota bacterium]
MRGKREAGSGKRFGFFVFILVFFTLHASRFPLHSQQPSPQYISLLKSPQQFDLFATSGWDGNWYVGYNSMWIVDLAIAAKQSDYVRAYIGSKMGRAKTQPIAGKPPWIRSPIPCDIYLGIASTPAWRSSDSYYLVSCEDLSKEGSSEDALNGVGESRWYWREIPLSKINWQGKNFLAIWSATPEIVDVSSGPILAAGYISGGARAWLNRGISGAPPAKPEDSLETPLAAFGPALAIKLVPNHAAPPIKVDLVHFQENPDGYLWEIQAAGANIERIRPEISVDASQWRAFGVSVFNPPYQVTVSRARIIKEVEELLPGNKKLDQAYIRITAWDEWGNSAGTGNFSVYVK